MAKGDRYYCPRCGQVAHMRGPDKSIVGDIFLPHPRWIDGESEICKGTRVREGNEAP